MTTAMSNNARSPEISMKKLILSATLLALFSVSQAQSSSSSSPASGSTTATPAPTTASKKQLIDRILKRQQPNIEVLARAIAESPAVQMSQQAGGALRRLPPGQQEAVGKGMQADLEKYLSETIPLVRERALALGPSTIGKVLDDQFTEAELKQVIVLLESPIYRKFSEQSLAMQRALQEKLVADTRGAVEPRIKALDQSWIKRFQDAAPATNATDKTIPPAPSSPGPTSK